MGRCLLGLVMRPGPRYTPTTCFETFPFPRPSDAQREAIAEAARDLDRLRTGWLNPPGPLGDRPRQRTLTNLYNARPAWLAQVHERLDAAVLDAYGWPLTITAEDPACPVAGPEPLESKVGLACAHRLGHRAIDPGPPLASALTPSTASPKDQGRRPPRRAWPSGASHSVVVRLPADRSAAAVQDSVSFILQSPIATGSISVLQVTGSGLAQRRVHRELCDRRRGSRPGHARKQQRPGRSSGPGQVRSPRSAARPAG